MSAEILRRAAEEMRRNAENATPGRWKLWGMTVMADQDGTSNVNTAVDVAATFYRDEHGKPRTWDATHIASWHPAVALAVADWLASVARDVDKRDNPQRVGGRFEALRIPDENAALLVARAYLGESA